MFSFKLGTSNILLNLCTKSHKNKPLNQNPPQTTAVGPKPPLSDVWNGPVYDINTIASLRALHFRGNSDIELVP